MKVEWYSTILRLGGPRQLIRYFVDSTLTAVIIGRDRRKHIVRERLRTLQQAATHVACRGEKSISPWTLKPDNREVTKTKAGCTNERLRGGLGAVYTSQKGKRITFNPTTAEHE